MLTIFKYLSGIALGAAGVAMWVYTPWWVWGAALVMAGLGILRFGGAHRLHVPGGRYDTFTIRLRGTAGRNFHL